MLIFMSLPFGSNIFVLCMLFSAGVNLDILRPICLNFFYSKGIIDVKFFENVW